MSDSSKKYIDKDCSKKCDQSFHKCMSSKEHESVCRMKRAQCDCGCAIS